MIADTLNFVNRMIGVRRPLTSTNGLSGFVGANQYRFTAVIWNETDSFKNLVLKLNNMPSGYVGKTLVVRKGIATSDSLLINSNATFNAGQKLMTGFGLQPNAYALIELK